jgi:hypothetical protein
MDQNSPEWFAARAGKVTASVFADVLAKGEGKTRRSLMLKLAGEICTGDPMQTYQNADMQRGKDQEDDIRNRYALLHDAEPVRVGFLEETDFRAGASPDALLGSDGILEIKSAAPHVLIEKIARGTFPSEHVAQCQGALWVSGREWIDIAVGCPKLPLFVKRAYRDEAFIKTLAAEVVRFNADLDELVAQVRRYGQPSTLKADLSGSLLMAG